MFSEFQLLKNIRQKKDLKPFNLQIFLMQESWSYIQRQQLQSKALIQEVTQMVQRPPQTIDQFNLKLRRIQSLHPSQCIQELKSLEDENQGLQNRLINMEEEYRQARNQSTQLQLELSELRLKSPKRRGATPRIPSHSPINPDVIRKRLEGLVWQLEAELRNIAEQQQRGYDVQSIYFQLKSSDLQDKKMDILAEIKMFDGVLYEKEKLHQQLVYTDKQREEEKAYFEKHLRSVYLEVEANQERRDQEWKVRLEVLNGNREDDLDPIEPPIILE